MQSDSLETRLEQDLKTALLAGDKSRVTTLRTLKSVLLSAKVDGGKRDSGLTDDEVVTLLSKEAKKRQESADLYLQGGDQVRADAELAEKAIIATYLPAQLSEAEVTALVDEVMAEMGTDKSAMGRIIGEAKKRAGAAADGGVIARIVKEKLQ